ncbi:putative bacteriophage protein [Nocardia nova SH22a]|uniref:Putative bacteriophage protein n=1 Tax=Nocardia nova SH22a TaxID=1415166 RepID=W5TNV4_9NOCA|nr:glycosyltransferase [Nocardia nova]AHH20839.1 putative bacteriophage protein [Nocardia nova SH22a]
MTSLSCAVVAHTDRLGAATDLAALADAQISIDDGTLGAETNHLRAWAMTRNHPSDWALVLEDDARPVPGFTEQVHAALRKAPAAIVSLYLGRTRPRTWQHRIAQALDQADMLDAHWITTHHLLHGVAVAMRTELRDDWIQWAASSELPIDERFGAWARERGHPIAYAVPSLVEHADWPTLIRHRDGQPRDQGRIAWRTGTRDIWTSRSVFI